MKKKLSFVTASLVVALLFSGCGKIPQAEIDVANQAIDSAKIAGAEMYVPDAFAALQDSMMQVMADIEEMNSKNFRNYGSAKEQLAGIAELAGEVRKQAETRKKEVRVEISNLLGELKVLIDENKTLLTKAPKGKEGTAALVAIKNELAAIETTLGEVAGMADSGDLLGSLDKVKASMNLANQINAELKDALAKYARR